MNGLTNISSALPYVVGFIVGLPLVVGVGWLGVCAWLRRKYR